MTSHRVSIFRSHIAPVQPAQKRGLPKTADSLYQDARRAQPHRRAQGAQAQWSGAGWVRIDSAHQGDLDGIKGVYHITCVDAVSQWQVQSCVQVISEAFLLLVLEMVIEQFPFQVEGFHSDNGSEYTKYKVAKMLGKLRIAQTKSRSRNKNNNDNAPAESKNANVVS